jgi:hypothetical protein
MSEKYLRHKEKGTIYSWNPVLADRTDVLEEVSELEAFPERFIPKATKGRKAKVNMATEDIPEAPEFSFPELNAEASRGL